MTRLCFALALVAFGLASAPAEAKAEECACTPAEPSACVIEVAATHAAPAHTFLLWCERADDPRCSPATPVPSSPELGGAAPDPLAPVPLVHPVPPAHRRTVRFLRSALVAGPGGHRSTLERPPRGA